MLGAQGSRKKWSQNRRPKNPRRFEPFYFLAFWSYFRHWWNPNDVHTPRLSSHNSGKGIVEVLIEVQGNGVKVKKTFPLVWYANAEKLSNV